MAPVVQFRNVSTRPTEVMHRNVWGPSHLQGAAIICYLHWWLFMKGMGILHESTEWSVWSLQEVQELGRIGNLSVH